MNQVGGKGLIRIVDFYDVSATLDSEGIMGEPFFLKVRPASCRWVANYHWQRAGITVAESGVI